MQATLDSVRAANKKSAWKDLTAHYKKLRGTHLRQLFENDPKRGERYTLEAHSRGGAASLHARRECVCTGGSHGLQQDYGGGGG